MDHKKSVARAIENYYKRQEPSEEPRRKNEKPEAEVVQKILIWLKQNDFDAMTVEAKATYSVQRGGYTGRAASPGTPDIIGNYKTGLSCWIEAKAKGRRSTLRELQREFLIRKIQSNCFAVVVDSVECLENIWNQFRALPHSDRQMFLLNQLPVKKDEEQGSLFD